ncbi:MAG: hypothetical protein BGO37_10630 [Cellulomonas sp. 73-92]|uniref:hypothetical protein n=1 Tax=Cellulomonas sp. 73-92 TaxID=1895740 RepID=UPI00092CBE92|nr:hypothetical protein [Cellulomonas sp. 73-92]OJV76504.1 MAG: hypothetical protein BGO37_10630 [Cellulomonas sp. 73-92]
MAWPITAADIREALKGVTAAVVSDAEADRWAEVAMTRIEDEVGLCRGQTGQFWYSRSWRERLEVVLPQNVASIQSVTVDGLAVGYTFDPPASIVGPIPPGLLAVSWTAPPTAAANIEEAAITLAAFLARQRKISDRRTGATTSDVPQGFALPNAVVELIGRRAADRGGFA